MRVVRQNCRYWWMNLFSMGWREAGEMERPYVSVFLLLMLYPILHFSSRLGWTQSSSCSAWRMRPVSMPSVTTTRRWATSGAVPIFQLFWSALKTRSVIKRRGVSTMQKYESWSLTWKTVLISRHALPMASTWNECSLMVNMTYRDQLQISGNEITKRYRVQLQPVRKSSKQESPEWRPVRLLPIRVHPHPKELVWAWPVSITIIITITAVTITFSARITVIAHWIEQAIVTYRCLTQKAAKIHWMANSRAAAIRTTGVWPITVTRHQPGTRWPSRTSSTSTRNRNKYRYGWTRCPRPIYIKLVPAWSRCTPRNRCGLTTTSWPTLATKAIIRRVINLLVFRSIISRLICRYPLAWPYQSIRRSNYLFRPTRHRLCKAWRVVQCHTREKWLSHRIRW